MMEIIQGMIYLLISVGVGSADDCVDKESFFQLQQDVVAMAQELKSLQKENIDLKLEVANIKDMPNSQWKTDVKRDVKMKTLGVHERPSLYTTGPLHENMNYENQDKGKDNANVIITKMAGNSGFSEGLMAVGGKAGNKRFLLGPEEVGVAFSAELTQWQVYHHGQGQTVIFDKVISNLGNGYDANAGMFRVPVQGWYVFSLTIMTLSGDKQQLDVVQNGSPVFHCYSDGDEYNTASRTIVIHANTGDDIWVKTTNDFQHSDAVNGYGHTSFTGFLLYADSN